MKKLLVLIIMACCLVVTIATSNAGSQFMNVHLLSNDTLPLRDTAAENKLRNKQNDTFGGLKNMIDTNNLKAKSDSLHKHPPKN